MIPLQFVQLNLPFFHNSAGSKRVSRLFRISETAISSTINEIQDLQVVWSGEAGGLCCRVFVEFAFFYFIIYAVL